MEQLYLFRVLIRYWLTVVRLLPVSDHPAVNHPSESVARPANQFICSYLTAVGSSGNRPKGVKTDYSNAKPTIQDLNKPFDLAMASASVRRPAPSLP